jgi:hypothetical protein
MGNVLALLLNRVIVKDVSTSDACYRDGESVSVRAEFISFESTDVELEAALEISRRGAVVDSHRETVRFAPRQEAVKTWQWSPAGFDDDEYTVTVSLR